jgi:RNA polymerase sigma-70 factor (ECF subfamily)
MAAAFTAYDLDRLTDLLLDGAVSEVVGAVYEDGADVIRRGSLHHTLVIEDDRRYRAEVHELDGEPLLVLWARPTKGTASPSALPDGSTLSEEAVADILRVETADGRVARVRWYYFCPQTLLEVSAGLGLPARPLG